MKSLFKTFFCRLGFHCNGSLRSLGANSACQLSPVDVWFTWKWATHPFHRVQQRTILVGLGTRDIISVLVNTYVVTLLLVVVVFSHQVPMILLGPARWTIIPCGHDEHRATWLGKANGADCIIVMDVFLQWVESVDFILGAIHVSCVLMSIFVLVVLWIVWKAKIINPTTLMSIMFTTNYT